MLGVAFMVAELFAPSFGALGIGGVIAFVAGSVMLMDTEATGYTIAWPLIGAVTLTTAGFFLGVLGMLARFHRRPAVTGREELVGASATVSPSADGRLRVRVHGELWGASSNSPLRAGQTVRVTALKGLTLQVEPAPDPFHQGG